MRNRIPKVLAGISLLSVTAMGITSAGASPANVVNNGSFESGNYTGGDFETLSTPSSAIDNWNVTSGSVDWIGSYWNSQDGDYSIDLNGTGPGAISQTLTTVVGATYDVSFYLSGNFDNILSSGSGNTQRTKTTMVSATGAAPYPYTATYDSKWSHSNMEWAPQMYQFTAGSTSTVLTFSGDATAGGWGPVIDNVNATRVGLGGGNSPAYDPSTSVNDSYNNFMIVDTNRPVTGTGELTNWSYYASKIGGSVALVVTSPVQALTSSTTILYVSPLSVPSTTGLVTASLPSPVAVAAGDQVGLYFQGVPVVVPFTFTTSPPVNAGCTVSCIYYSGNDSFGSAPTAGTVTFQGASSRYYSFSVDGFTVPDAPTIGSATSDGVGSVNVTWSAPAWDGGSAITGYDVYAGTSPGNENYSSAVCSVGPSATYCDATGLNNGTTYYFTVEAVNAVGNSLPSGEVSTMTWYDFSGFYSPIKFGNSSTSPNVAKAGSAIPIQFSLGGVSSLDIFATNTPTVLISACSNSIGPSPTSTAGNSSLTYDPTTDSYTYPWKTSKGWAGCTGVLTLTFSQPVSSGVYTELAYFQFH